MPGVAGQELVPSEQVHECLSVASVPAMKEGRPDYSLHCGGASWLLSAPFLLYGPSHNVYCCCCCCCCCSYSCLLLVFLSLFSLSVRVGMSVWWFK